MSKTQLDNVRCSVYYVTLYYQTCSPIGTPRVDSDLLHHDSNFI